MKLQFVALVAAMTLGPMASMAEVEYWKRRPEIMERKGILAFVGERQPKIVRKCIGSGVLAPQLFSGPGSDAPIDIRAKRIAARNVFHGREVTFEGSVKVRQADLTVECDKLIIIYDERKGSFWTTGIKSIECLCER